MTDIIQALDDWTNEQYAELQRKLFGFCELVKKNNPNSEQPFPKTIPSDGRQSEQVSLRDKYDLVTWFRLPGTVQQSNNIDDQNWAFGLDDGHVQTANLRWVVAHKSSLGENFIHEFVKEIPSILDVDGYQVVSIDRTATSIDFDHDVIHNTELGETNYEKHRFTWNLYAITLNVEFIICETSE